MIPLTHDLEVFSVEEALQRVAWRLSIETPAAYPRILAERGQQYAAGWLAARTHIAELLEATK